MSEKIKQLVYTSKSKNVLSSQEIFQLLEKCRFHNSANGLTGMLVYRQGYFMQLLEGEEYNIGYTFKKIRDDQRHHQINLIHNAEVQERIFPQWSMAHIQPEKFDPSLDQKIEHFLKGNAKISTLEILQALRMFLKMPLNA